MLAKPKPHMESPKSLPRFNLPSRLNPKPSETSCIFFRQTLGLFCCRQRPPSILQSFNPSILQSFNPSILQSFNPSILQSFNLPCKKPGLQAEDEPMPDEPTPAAESAESAAPMDTT